MGNLIAWLLFGIPIKIGQWAGGGTGGGFLGFALWYSFLALTTTFAVSFGIGAVIYKVLS